MAILGRAPAHLLADGARVAVRGWAAGEGVIAERCDQWVLVDLDRGGTVAVRPDDDVWAL